MYRDRNVSSATGAATYIPSSETTSSSAAIASGADANERRTIDLQRAREPRAERLRERLLLAERRTLARLVQQDRESRADTRRCRAAARE